MQQCCCSVNEWFHRRAWTIWFTTIVSVYAVHDTIIHMFCSPKSQWTVSVNLSLTALLLLGTATQWWNLNLINCSIFTALSPELSQLILFFLRTPTLRKRWAKIEYSRVEGILKCCMPIYTQLREDHNKAFSPVSSASSKGRHSHSHMRRCGVVLLKWTLLLGCYKGCPQTDSILLHPDPPTCHLLHL